MSVLFKHWRQLLALGRITRNATCYSEVSSNRALLIQYNPLMVGLNNFHIYLAKVAKSVL